MTLGDKGLLAVGDIVGIANQRGVGTRDIAWGVASAGGIREGTANYFIAVRGGKRVRLGSYPSNCQLRVSIQGEGGGGGERVRGGREREQNQERIIPVKTDTAVSNTRELDSTRILMNPIKVEVNESEKRKTRKEGKRRETTSMGKIQDSAVAGNEGLVCVSQKPRCSVCLAPLIGEW